ncbi:hypothetical protein SmJEL517_g03573 [Synchytrium microbalum]|uniref:RING-type domain-containing protein n=1 Tax=Synchytrium microbalum TaxID=1806994 RepID=A0A507C6M7_9FUNG|nr:uncharacterized protein SmJEL517_g03573 [Synchytrium microbalum]TPX33626.1 hypothetical protein SmJEL517_g03573 [Synchytrium microbalum]
MDQQASSVNFSLPGRVSEDSIGSNYSDVLSSSPNDRPTVRLSKLKSGNQDGSNGQVRLSMDSHAGRDSVDYNISTVNLITETDLTEESPVKTGNNTNTTSTSTTRKKAPTSPSSNESAIENYNESPTLPASSAWDFDTSDSNNNIPPQLPTIIPDPQPIVLHGDSSTDTGPPPQRQSSFFGRDVSTTSSPRLSNGIPNGRRSSALANGRSSSHHHNALASPLSNTPNDNAENDQSEPPSRGRPSRLIWMAWRLFLLLETLTFGALIGIGGAALYVDQAQTCDVRLYQFLQAVVSFLVMQTGCGIALLVGLPWESRWTWYNHRRIRISTIIWLFSIVVLLGQTIMIPVGFTFVKLVNLECIPTMQRTIDAVFLISLISACAFVIVSLPLCCVPCVFAFAEVPEYRGISPRALDRLETVTFPAPSTTSSSAVVGAAVAAAAGSTSSVDGSISGGIPSCAICLEVMTEGKKLPCGHMYHKHCLSGWVDEHRSWFCKLLCRFLGFADSRMQRWAAVGAPYLANSPVRSIDATRQAVIDDTLTSQTTQSSDASINAVASTTIHVTEFTGYLDVETLIEFYPDLFELDIPYGADDCFVLDVATRLLKLEYLNGNNRVMTLGLARYIAALRRPIGLRRA